MPRLSRDERLDKIALEVNKGWSNSEDIWAFDVDDIKFLLNQAYEAERLREVLHNAQDVLQKHHNIYDGVIEVVGSITQALEETK